jgi:ribosomal protein S18 acetylase RimI-like enzyme
MYNVYLNDNTSFFDIILSMIIRHIEKTDISSIAPIHHASRIESERGIIRDNDLGRDSIETIISQWDTWLSDNEFFALVATNDANEITGFIAYGRVKTRPAQDRGVVPKYGAEIYALYVHPDHWRQRVATSLFQAACTHLSEMKLNSLLLWVLKKNKRAVTFYETFNGAERIGKQRVDIGTDSWAEETCIAWRDIRKIKV